jgi:threonine aldolase
LSSIVNLRSDTQTMPTAAMLKAVSEAELGDDTHREDPTVRALEERVAAMTGFEAALLVLSGTMANLVALMTHCRPGDEVFLDRDAHVLVAEAGGLARIAGAVPTVVAGERGHPLPGDLAAKIRPPDVIRPRPRLVWLENTHNLAGGTVLTPDKQTGITQVARRHGLMVHLDGARVPNAAAALGLPWTALTEGVDSAYLDFTKGLSCPMGAVVVGSRDFVEQARHHRRVLGGGMRQAGFMAACALNALDDMVDRISEDHETAKLLARLLAASDHYRVVAPPETNLVVVDVSGLGPPSTVADRLSAAGVLVSLRPPHNLRLVTHAGITSGHVRTAVNRMEAVAKEMVKTTTAKARSAT